MMTITHGPTGAIYEVSNETELNRLVFVLKLVKLIQSGVAA